MDGLHWSFAGRASTLWHDVNHNRVHKILNNNTSALMFARAQQSAGSADNDYIRRLHLTVLHQRVLDMS